MKTKRQLWNHFMLVLFVLLTFMPFIVMLINSLKNRMQMLESLILPGWPMYFSNYSFAMKQILPYVVNSLYVTIVTVVGVILVAGITGYTFARFRFPGKNLFFLLIIVNMMVPGILMIVPQFLIIQDLGLYNTRWGLILPYIVGGQVMGIYMIRGFVEELPEMLFESARIDGAKEYQVFTSIAIPLIKPILSTVAILNVLSSWNDIVWPLIILKDSALKTIPIGLAEFNTFYGTEYGKLFAGYAIVSIPLLVFFLVTMRSFMNGMMEGAVKG